MVWKEENLEMHGAVRGDCNGHIRDDAACPEDSVKSSYFGQRRRESSLSF